MTATKPRPPAVSVLEVLLNDDLVGTLTHVPDERTIWAFDPAYADDRERPTLSLSFKDASGGGLVTRDRPSHVTLPPFFSNLLPEGPLRGYLAARGPVNPEREFFLLWLLSEDLPGAVRVRPPAGQELPPSAAAAHPDDPEPADRMFRFSLAGIQLKFSAVAEAHGGLTIPVTGVGGTWIAKLPSTSYAAVPENEYVMLELARAAGVTAPEARLVPLTDLRGLPAGAFAGTGRALAVRRFDRGPGGIRIHMEDFAQVFGQYPADKYGRASYEDIARVLWAETGEPGVTELARRLAVITLLGNADMHLKNWSVLYPNRRAPVLSPAYDMVSTIPYIPEPELALSLGETKSMLEVDEDRFRRFAKRAGLPDRIVVAAARDATERLREAWRTHPATDLLPRFIRDAVSAHLDRAPLGRG